MIGVKKDIIYDLDGSLSVAFDGTARSVRTSGTLVQNYPHIAQYNQNTCPSATDPTLWDNAIMCNQNKVIRKIVFTNLMEFNTFKMQTMKVVPINSFDEVVPTSIADALHTRTHNKLDNKEPMK